MNGEKLSLKSPADAIARGIVMVPEDRKLQGVVVGHKIDENLVYANLDRFGNGWITPAKKRSFADKAICAFGVKGARRTAGLGSLGGNQQKVVIAKWLTRDPKVVVLDEPTRGIDVGARAGIYDIIANLAREGVAVIVVSSDLEEVLGVSTAFSCWRRASRLACSTASRQTTSRSWNWPPSDHLNERKSDDRHLSQCTQAF